MLISHKSMYEDSTWKFIMKILDPLWKDHKNTGIAGMSCMYIGFPMDCIYSCSALWQLTLKLPYSSYYKTLLYKILSHFAATCIQVFDDFLLFKPWKLILGANSIQERLIIARIHTVSDFRFVLATSRQICRKEPKCEH